jgi:hypothetical protein
MRSFRILAAAVALGLALTAAFSRPVEAQNAPASGAPENDFWSRPQLTGNWGGGRDWLSAHGVTIDANGVYTFQGVADDGANRGNRLSVSVLVENERKQVIE